MRTILTVTFVFLFLVLSIPFLGIEWLIARKNPKATDYPQLRTVQWAFRVVCFLSGVRLTVIGEENVPKDEAVLFIGNHRSFFDVVITYARCRGLTGYIAKDSIEKVPLLSTYMRRLHCLFLNRDNPREGLKTILAAIDLVKNGISVCVFPEGTRCKDKEHPANMLPFRDGAFKIATKTGCRIVPMAMIGSDNILENHFPWIHSTQVTLIYGTPIDTRSLDPQQKKQISEITRASIQAMLDEYCPKTTDAASGRDQESMPS